MAWDVSFTSCRAASQVPLVRVLHMLFQRCIVLTEGRRILERELEMGGALQRSPHRTHTGAFHFLFELYPGQKSKTGARR